MATAEKRIKILTDVEIDDLYSIPAFTEESTKKCGAFVKKIKPPKVVPPSI